MKKRVCNYCNWPLKFKYILRCDEYEKIRCPYCGRPLKATKMSKILFRYIQMLIAILIAVMPLKLPYILIMLGLWISFSTFFVPPIVYSYEYKD